MKSTLKIICASLAVFCAATSALAAEIHSLGAKSDLYGHTQVTVNYAGAAPAPKIFTIPGDTVRIVIDSDTAKVASGFTHAPAAGITGVRYAPRGQGSRLVLDLAPGAKLLDSRYVSNIAHLSIKPGASAPASVTRARPVSAGGIAIPRLKPVGTASAPLAKRLIVIDAGHGGYDPGALSATGAKEKTFTLAAAKELQKQLLKTGRYNVYLTRDKDVYVDHYERVRRARVREADLFISLHADALDSRSTRGASVYTLASYAQDRSTKLVDKQNFIVDVDLRETTDSVGDILVSLAQKKTFSNSHKFAQMLIPELEKVAPILRNTHRQKGLAVLLAPDVPAVLLEMGYISNALDEKALKSPKERSRKMKAVVTTIDAYFYAQNQ